jgi:hypothetical protein
MKGVLPWMVRWARRAGTRDFCPALAAPLGPVQNIFLLMHTISLHLSLAQQAAQAVVLCRCLLMCLWIRTRRKTGNRAG